MDITDYICMPLHWIVLSTANFRLQIFSGTNELLHSLCSSNFTFGAGWLLRGRHNLFSWLLPWPIFSGNYLGLAHEKSLASIFPYPFRISISHFCFLIKVSEMSRESFFLLRGKEGLLYCSNFLFLVIFFPLKLWQPFISVLA